VPTSLHDQHKASPETGPDAGVKVKGKLAAAESNQDFKLESSFKNRGACAKQNYNWLPTLLQAYLFVPLGLLLLEVFFSFAGIGQGEIVKPDVTLGSRHIANKLVTWRLEGYSHDRLSSVGLRDVEHTVAKPAGVKRLIFLGDSYTEGLQVPLQDTFARRLQTTLNTGQWPKYETINFGCSSYSTGQEMLQFDRQAAAYKPDLVVLLYTPGDTLENSVSPIKRTAAEARPYFYLDQNKELQQDNGVLTLNYEKLRPRPLREFLRAHSTIFGAYAQTNLSLIMSDKVYFRATRLVSQIASKIALLVTSAGHDQAPPAGLLPPTWTEPDKLAVSEAIIKKLDHQVRAAGGKLVVMAYPDIGKGDPVYISARQRFAKLAKQEGFGYLDLSDAFSHDVDPNNLFVKVHFSKLGHDLTARQLTAYLKSSGFLPN
jgi:lysophospholipase L1-like esterase